MASALLFAGCKQGEGDRCEIDSDCRSGLICDNPQGTGGVCRASLAGTQDAAPDVATADAPRDTAVTPDVATPDAGTDRTPDTSAATDTAAEAATSDTGTDTSATTDATTAESGTDATAG